MNNPNRGAKPVCTLGGLGCPKIHFSKLMMPKKGFHDEEMALGKTVLNRTLKLVIN